MKPVYQTKFGPGIGNCFEACIASIMEIPIEHVPSFPIEDQAGALAEWLESCGWGMVYFVHSSGIRSHIKFSNGLHVVVGGRSPRFKCLHGVVFKDGVMVHDPHPDGTGIKSIIDFTVIFKMEA